MIIIIIIFIFHSFFYNYFTTCEFVIPVLTLGFSLKFEGQQFSVLLDSFW